MGRAITAPKAGEANSRLKFAFASCQNWEAGLWTAYDHMLAEDPELVVHLGDYIYEGPARPTAVRPHNGAEIMSLTDYRNRHARIRRQHSAASRGRAATGRQHGLQRRSFKCVGRRASRAGHRQQRSRSRPDDPGKRIVRPH